MQRLAGNFTQTNICCPDSYKPQVKGQWHPNGDVFLLFNSIEFQTIFYSSAWTSSRKWHWFARKPLMWRYFKSFRKLWSNLTNCSTSRGFIQLEAFHIFFSFHPQSWCKEVIKVSPPLLKWKVSRNSSTDVLTVQIVNSKNMSWFLFGGFFVLFSLPAWGLELHFKSRHQL